MDNANDPELKTLLSAALELRDQGLEPPLDELCRHRPDLREAVERALVRHKRLGLVQAASEPVTTMTGRMLGDRYRLGERLGAGAMGVVYAAEDLQLGRQVAVKVLRSLLIDGEEAERRFDREARSLAAIRHPAVITVHDRGRTHDEDPYVVLELLEGLSLADLLELAARRQAGRDAHWVIEELGVPDLPETSWLRLVASWMAELASGLDAAHAQGILHRDVKPSNIFLCRDGRVVLLDFGISTVRDQDAITRSGSAVGTPAYMAPESLNPAVEIGPALDVYGLCATLYHALTLRPPYRGTPSQIISALVREDPPRASRVCHNLPRDLQAILDRGLARRPEHRYATAGDLESDLRAFLEHRPLVARPLNVVQRGWRAVVRSHVYRLLVGLGLAGAVLVGTRAWMQHLDEQRGQAFRSAWRQLPANLTVVRGASRALPTIEERTRELLDEAVRQAPGALHPRLLRGSFRLDHGELPQALSDLRVVFAKVGTDYARELANRYADLPADARGVEGLDLSQMPEPITPDDWFLQAYHLLRFEERPAAEAIFLQDNLSDHLPAQHYAPLGLIRKRAQMIEATLALEMRLGGRTGHTASILSLAYVLDKDYQRALEIGQEGLALAPDSLALLMNAGRAAWRLSDGATAIRHLRRATECDPGYFRPQEMLARVLIDDGRFSEARQVIAALPREDVGFPAYLPQQLQGELEAERALTEWDAGAIEEGVEIARQSLEHFEQVRMQKPGYDSHRRQLALGVVSSDLDAVALSLARLIRKNGVAPPRRVEILLRLLPETTTPLEGALADVLEVMLDQE